jgi:hypothetical protein
MRVPPILRTYWAIYLATLALIEPLTWFSVGKRLSISGPLANIAIFTVPAVAAAVALLLSRLHRNPKANLTPKAPVDSRVDRRTWVQIASGCELTNLLAEREATTLLPWQGVGLQEITLVYHASSNQYPHYGAVMPEVAKSALEFWKSRNAESYRRREQESWGLQVRLERVRYEHADHKYIIDLSPAKFLYYLSLQARLWDPVLSDLRQEAFNNALTFIESESRPLLPNHFALHMAIVSSDAKLLIRKRPKDTPLYPSVWEASIGEFMHGPEHRRYPHFTRSGKPSIRLFCKNSVAEEINYRNASPRDFRVYGFGIEYRTLAPKMFVIYRSAETMQTLLRQGRPPDRGSRLSSIDLTPESLGRVFSHDSEFLWSPSSRIISLLALRDSVENQYEKDRLLDQFAKSYKT